MPRTAASIQAELDACDAAILRAYSAAAVGSNGNTLQNQQLAALRAARSDLQRELDLQSDDIPRFQPTTITGLGS
jgi:hypothetical protein